MRKKYLGTVVTAAFLAAFGTASAQNTQIPTPDLRGNTPSVNPSVGVDANVGINNRQSTDLDPSSRMNQGMPGSTSSGTFSGQATGSSAAGAGTPAMGANEAMGGSASGRVDTDKPKARAGAKTSGGASPSKSKASTGASTRGHAHPHSPAASSGAKAGGKVDKSNASSGASASGSVKSETPSASSGAGQRSELGQDAERKQGLDRADEAAGENGRQGRDKAREKQGIDRP